MDNRGVVRTISVQELKQLQDNKENFQLVDVREPAEYEAANLGGVLIPVGEIMSRATEIARDKKVVVHCRSGRRSEMAVQLLQQQYGFENLYNLEGGIVEYAAKIDPSLHV